METPTKQASERRQRTLKGTPVQAAQDALARYHRSEPIYRRLGDHDSVYKESNTKAAEREKEIER